jgi:hypothetical protein
MFTLKPLCRYRGVQCRCIQDPVRCDPDDSFDVILSCDNINGISDATCTYSKTVGTSYSQEVEEGMMVHTSVEAELQLQFFNRFKTLLNVSHETGYDWNQVSTASQSESVTISVS